MATVKNDGVVQCNALFRSKYSPRIQKQQDLSREVEDVFSLNDDGVPVKVGEENVYERIQVSLEETQVYNVLKRYESGDLAAIGNPNAGMSGDFTNIPSDIIGSTANMDVAIANWSKLPQGLRDLYHNNVSEFMKASPEDINSKVSTYVDSLNAATKKEENE